MAGRYRIILHPSCPSSREVVLGLAERGLLDKVDLVVLDRPMPVGGVFPWSVPLIVDPSGEPLAMDPVDAVESAEILEGRWDRSVDDFEAFYWSIVYSAYASATLLVHGSPEPLLEESFLKPALRLPLRGLSVEEARERLRPRLGEILEGKKRDVIVRALAVAVARYYYWAGGRDPERLAGLGPEGVGAVLLAMASIGRSNLPWKPKPPEAAGELADFLARGARGLLRKIEREQEQVLGYEEYQEILSKAAGRRG